MSAPAIHTPHPHRYTIRDYHRMAEAEIFAPDDRMELIQGEIIDMTPIGSGHAGIVNRLNSIFSQKTGNNLIISTQNPVVLNDFSEPQPDLALLRFREDFYTRAHPQAEDVLLIVEVADTTLQYDREVKLPLYAVAGISEVWLVDVKGKKVDIYRRPEEGCYVEQKSSDNLNRVEVMEVGICFDLSGIFEG